MSPSLAGVVEVWEGLTTVGSAAAGIGTGWVASWIVKAFPRIVKTIWGYKLHFCGDILTFSARNAHWWNISQPCFNHPGPGEMKFSGNLQQHLRSGSQMLHFSENPPVISREQSTTMPPFARWGAVPLGMSSSTTRPGTCEPSTGPHVGKQTNPHCHWKKNDYTNTIHIIISKEWHIFFPLPGCQQFSPRRVLVKIGAPKTWDDYLQLPMENPPGMYFPCVSLSQGQVRYHWK